MLIPAMRGRPSSAIQGAIVTDPDHPGYGTVLLNTANTDKAGMMTSAGHEVIESKVLQGKNGLFFDDSLETKERVADLFGERLTARMDEATEGGLSQTPGDWTSTMRQNPATALGTLLANTLHSGQVEYRQFVTRESRALDQARAKIKSNSIFSEAYKREALANLDALACAEVRCGSGSSKNDPLYKTYKDMEARGDQLKQTQQTNIYAMLDDLGVDSTEKKTVGRGRRQHTREEPLFGYSMLDAADDLIGSNEQVSGRVQQGAAVVGGAGAAIGGVTAATGLCVGSAGLGCVAGGLGGGYLFSEGTDAASEGWHALMSDYVYTNGALVKNSFSEATNQEAFSPTLALVLNVGLNVAGGVAGKRAGALLLREELPAVSRVGVDGKVIDLDRPTLPKASVVPDTTPRVVPGQSSNVRMDGHKIYDPNQPAISSNPTAQYRFSDPSFRSTGEDVYFGENVTTSYFEVRQNINGKSLFVGDVRVDNMLDLTDSNVLKQMNIDSIKLTSRVDNPVQQKAVYEYTNRISNQAYEAGYNGIIYSSSRKAGNNNAVVLFGGKYDPEKIKVILDRPIK
jgi:hypothetical protein